MENEIDITTHFWDIVHTAIIMPYDEYRETEIFKYICSCKDNFPYARYVLSCDAFIPWEIMTTVLETSNELDKLSELCEYDQARNVYIFYNRDDMFQICYLMMIHTMEYMIKKNKIDQVVYDRLKLYEQFSNKVGYVVDMIDLVNMFDACIFK